MKYITQPTLTPANNIAKAINNLTSVLKLLREQEMLKEYDILNN